MAFERADIWHFFVALLRYQNAVVFAGGGFWDRIRIDPRRPPETAMFPRHERSRVEDVTPGFKYLLKKIMLPGPA